MGAEEGVLSGLQNPNAQGPTTGLTTNDVGNFNFNMSPEDIAAFSDYQNQRQQSDSGPAWRMVQSDYYPEYRGGQSVGGGSDMFGSYSLFGNGAALVPMGMLDAQDAAVRNAASRRMKEVDDFKKSLVTPTSKLTNINDKLSNEFIDFTQGSWKKAMKASGGNPNAATYMLKNNPEFQKQLQGYYNSAKLYDRAADKLAQFEADRKTGNFVYTPTLQAAAEKLTRSMNPSDPNFKNFATNFQALNLEYDINKAFDEVSKNAFASETGRSGANLNDPEFIKEWKSSTKGWTPEQIKNFASSVEQNYFPGSDYFTPEKIKEYANNYFSGQKTTSDTSVKERTNTGAAAKGSEDDYTSAQMVPESETNSLVKSTVPTPYKDSTMTVKETKPAYAVDLYKTNAKHERMDVSIPIGPSFVDVKGEEVKGKNGYIKGNISGIQNMFFDKQNKKYLTKEEAYAAVQGKDKNVVSVPVAVLNTETKADDKGNVKAQNTVFIPVSEIKGKFSNKHKKEGQRDYDDLIKDVEARSNAYNEHINSTENKSATPAANTPESTYQIKGKSYKKQDVEAKAAASGMTPEEYVAELNKLK